VYQSATRELGPFLRSYGRTKALPSLMVVPMIAGLRVKLPARARAVKLAKRVRSSKMGRKPRAGEASELEYSSRNEIMDVELIFRRQSTSACGPECPHPKWLATKVKLVWEGSYEALGASAVPEAMISPLTMGSSG